MSRYKILLGKSPKEIKLERPSVDNIPLNLKQSFFTNAKVMVDYMYEIGGKWMPESNLYFGEIPLIGYKSAKVDEIVIIKAEDYDQTKRSLPELVREEIDKEKVFQLVKDLS